MSGSVEIGFSGNCGEAFEFYAAKLNGMIGDNFRNNESEPGEVVYRDIVIHYLLVFYRTGAENILD